MLTEEDILSPNHTPNETVDQSSPPKLLDPDVELTEEFSQNASISQQITIENANPPSNIITGKYLVKSIMELSFWEPEWFYQ